MKIKEYGVVLVGAKPVFEFIEARAQSTSLKVCGLFKKFDFCAVKPSFRVSNYFKVNERYGVST